MKKETVNTKIDNFLKIRRQSLYDLEKAIEGLYEMGIRFFVPTEEGVPEVSCAQNLLPRYEHTLEDFEWKAIYDDGTELDQYGEKQSHFGDIDQSKLAKIQYISNFEILTQNPEKRLIITLDFKKGTFDFWNCADQDIRAELSKPCEEEKKLILFKRKRQDFIVGMAGKEAKVESTGERFTYTRYYLGYETKNKKVVICLYPNGDIGIEEIK